LQKLKVVNLVATAELSLPVDLERLVYEPGFLYDAAIYHCAYLKDKNTKGKISIFASGKMISIGTRNLKEAQHDLNYAARVLAGLGLAKPDKLKVRLQNIVGVTRMALHLDLEKLSRELPLIYEPEQFSGAIYWADELEGASLLLFPTGKVVVAGLRRLDLIPVAERLIRDLALATPAQV
jgi:TATA-box binding protein (TBP) (component of TFIID and TFIIIB)